MASPETVVKMFALLTANWTKETVTDAQVTLYTKLLGDIPDALLEAATLDIIATSTWFPKVAEIRQAAYRIMTIERGLPTAGEAWGEVCRQILRIGSYGVPEFSHAIVKDAVRAMGGWIMLCRSEDQMADRAHFLKVYDVLAQRETQRVMMLPQVREVAERLDMGVRLARLEAGK